MLEEYLFFCWTGWQQYLLTLNIADTNWCARAQNPPVSCTILASTTFACRRARTLTLERGEQIGGLRKGKRL